MSIAKSHIHRILVRVPNWVGDAVMALPALEALKGNFPESALVVLAKTWVVPIFEGHPCVEAVLPYSKSGSYPRALLHVMRTASELRGMRFDLAVLFQNAFEAALLARLAGIPMRLGYGTDGRSFLLSHAVRRNREGAGHQVEYYLEILRSMGWKAESGDPRIQVGESRISSVRSLLHSCGIGDSDLLLGLGPGASYGPAKRWPVERFARIGDMAAERWGTRAVVLGSGGEKELGETLVHGMRHPAVNLCGRTGLGEAAAVLQRCRAFVTNDSGLMHIAAALDTPTVAVFGSTDPAVTGPRSRKARVVRHPIPCSPCLRADCRDGYPCLDSVQPREVWMALEQLTGEEN